MSFVIELDTDHRTIRHKSHMRHCIKSDEKISKRPVRFGPHVDFSEGSSALTESTIDRLDKPNTCLRAILTEKHRTVWPGQH